MAPETYYFFFSIISAVGILLYMINLIHLKIRGRALLGPNFKPGTPEHKRVAKLASNRNVAITIAVTLALTANLFFDIHRLLQLSNRTYAHALLIYAPISIVVLFVILFFKLRNMFDMRSK